MKIGKYSIVFIFGVISTLSFNWIRNYSQESHAKSVLKNRLSAADFAADQATMKLDSYINRTLPSEIVSHLNSKYSTYKVLSSCESNFIPGGMNEYFIMIRTADQDLALVAHFGPSSDPRLVRKVELIELKSSSDRSVAGMVTDCRRGASIVNHPSFTVDPAQLDFASVVDSQNREVLLVEAGDLSAEVYAFSVDEGIFIKIGLWKI